MLPAGKHPHQAEPVSHVAGGEITSGHLIMKDLPCTRSIPP